MVPRTKQYVVDDSSDDEAPQATPAPVGTVEENADLPALFWDSAPENPEDHPDFAAMQALRDECTPEERAETCKANGNRKLTVGVKANNKELLREAVAMYGQGLAENCDNQKLNAILYCNRAHVEALLGNWRKALDDALAAHKLDPDNIKAMFRGARAALHLKRFALCLELCEKGKLIDEGTGKEFDALEKEARGGLAKAEAEATAAAQAEEKRLAPARQLADAITQRGYKVAIPQMRTTHRWRPTLEPGSGQLSWPVVILYPEANSQDEIEAWHEDDTVADQMDAMFGPESPPLDWDEEREYTRDAIELYYLSWAGTPLAHTQLVEAMVAGHWPEGADANSKGSKAGQESKWVRVKESWTLHQLLSQPDLIIPGIPFLAAVAKDTEYRHRLLSQHKQ